MLEHIKVESTALEDLIKYDQEFPHELTYHFQMAKIMISNGEVDILCY